MSPAAESRNPVIGRFRSRLLVALMLIVSALTLLALYLAQWSAAQADFQRAFDAEVEMLDRLQASRTAAAQERCRTAAQRQRIRGALEENTLEYLYPNTTAELRDLLERGQKSSTPSNVLQGKFYRFIHSDGKIIPLPPRGAGVLLPGEHPGFLLPDEEAQLVQPTLPQSIQDGFLLRRNERTVDELIAMPIRASENDEVMAVLVLGIRPVAGYFHSSEVGMQSGIMVDGELRLPGVEEEVERRLGGKIMPVLAQSNKSEGKLRLTHGERRHWLYFKRLNPGSIYPPAYAVFLCPRPQLSFTQLTNRGQPWTWQILAAGGALLLGGFLVSTMISRRLANPVEKLAVVSEENLAQRQRAEAELQTTAEELQRSSRFSADASHQLKSPITVLRAGLDSLLARDGFPQEVYEEVSTLIHQTYRLTGVVEDLLLLSRMDAGKLRLNLHPVDLTHLVDEWLDDLQAMPEAADLDVETDIPEGLQIAGEIKYTSLVVQNLLDNARKYNQPGGTIRILAREEKHRVHFRVANTGPGIPAEAQPFIFERFHRAGASADVPGHGLGLNLAHELVRLHGGELRLIRSDAQWTEFGATFLAAVPAPKTVGATQ